MDLNLAMDDNRSWDLANLDYIQSVTTYFFVLQEI